MCSIPLKDRVMEFPSFRKLATTNASFYDNFFYFSKLFCCSDGKDAEGAHHLQQLLNSAVIRESVVP
jgi:hypothetical protein